MEKIVSRFTASSDKGNTYTVNVFQDQVETTTIASTQREFTGGLKRYALEDGRAINVISDGVYKIVQTEEIIRRS